MFHNKDENHIVSLECDSPLQYPGMDFPREAFTYNKHSKYK